MTNWPNYADLGSFDCKVHLENGESSRNAAGVGRVDCTAEIRIEQRSRVSISWVSLSFVSIFSSSVRRRISISTLGLRIKNEKKKSQLSLSRIDEKGRVKMEMEYLRNFIFYETIKPTSKFSK